MEQKKEITSFTCRPDIAQKAKDNAWRERKSLSEVIERLLIRYNKSKEKQTKELV